MLPILMTVILAASIVWGQEPVSIHFRAVVGNAEFACGKSYSGVGIAQSTIAPRDFRFYIHDLQFIDDEGNLVPLQLKQDGKWQLDDVALLDFEDATAGCRNGTADTNRQVMGTIPEGTHVRGVRFRLGVPMSKNHTDLVSMPAPLNLTAMAWTWNAGRRFMRIEFSSTGLPRGYIFHLGSTGCTPNNSTVSIPTRCEAPNRALIELPNFDPASQDVVVDLAALLKDSNVDNPGCESNPDTRACGPLFLNLGLPFPGQPNRMQTFFGVASRR